MAWFDIFENAALHCVNRIAEPIRTFRNVFGHIPEFNHESPVLLKQEEMELTENRDSIRSLHAPGFKPKGVGVLTARANAIFNFVMNR